MNIETSISLPEDILDVIDKLSEQYQNRSEWIEMALRSFIAQITHEQNVHDIEII